MIDAGFDQPEAQSGCPIAFTYTQAEVRHMLRANDFLATEITQDHIFPYVVRNSPIRLRAAAVVRGDAARDVSCAGEAVRLAHAQ